MLMQLARAAWSFRGFIAGSVKREFVAKYRSSLLGAGWAVINPLAMVIIYTVVFSRIMQARLPGSSGTFEYGIYLCAGIFAWNFFAEIVQRSMSMFLDNAGMIKKMNFPRICLPVIAMLNAGMNYAIISALFLLLLLVLGRFPGAYLVAMLPVVAVVCLLATSLGIIVGVVNVFFRDAGQLFTILLQFWFWFTPIVYPISILPESIASLVGANPLTPLITALQGIALGTGWPDWSSLVSPLLLAIVLAALALMLFRRRSYEMVDEL